MSNRVITTILLLKNVSLHWKLKDLFQKWSLVQLQMQITNTAFKANIEAKWIEGHRVPT